MRFNRKPNICIIKRFIDSNKIIQLRTLKNNIISKISINKSKKITVNKSKIEKNQKIQTICLYFCIIPAIIIYELCLFIMLYIFLYINVFQKFYNLYFQIIVYYFNFIIVKSDNIQIQFSKFLIIKNYSFVIWG